jgi:hypothetical protein
VAVSFAGLVLTFVGRANTHDTTNNSSMGSLVRRDAAGCGAEPGGGGRHGRCRIELGVGLALRQWLHLGQGSRPGQELKGTVMRSLEQEYRHFGKECFRMGLSPSFLRRDHVDLNRALARVLVKTLWICCFMHATLSCAKDGISCELRKFLSFPSSRCRWVSWDARPLSRRIWRPDTKSVVDLAHSSRALRVPETTTAPAVAPPE